MRFSCATCRQVHSSPAVSCFRRLRQPPTHCPRCCPLAHCHCCFCCVPRLSDLPRKYTGDVSEQRAVSTMSTFCKDQTCEFYPIVEMVCPPFTHAERGLTENKEISRERDIGIGRLRSNSFCAVQNSMPLLACSAFFLVSTFRTRQKLGTLRRRKAGPLRATGFILCCPSPGE